MYGTIARMRIKPGKEAELAELARRSSAVTPGLVFYHTYRLDADPNEHLLVIAFESKEAYRANAESPEQHERYLSYKALLESEPEWHDGGIVSSYPE